MSELILTILQIGFLVLLWVFVLSVVATLRRDIYGVRVRKRGQKPQAVAPVNYSRQQARPKKQVARPARDVPSKIIVTDGPLVGTTVPLGNASIIVGRSPDSALVLNDSYSSSRHARFFQSEGHWYVEDLQSTNGTFVHGQRIDHPIPVKAGDSITIGQTTFTLQR